MQVFPLKTPLKRVTLKANFFFVSMQMLSEQKTRLKRGTLKTSFSFFTNLIQVTIKNYASKEALLRRNFFLNFLYLLQQFSASYNKNLFFEDAALKSYFNFLFCLLDQCEFPSM